MFNAMEHCMVRMMKNSFRAMMFFGLILLSGCAGSQQFVPIPRDLDVSAVPKKEIAVQAKRFTFVPDTIVVSQGTLVHLTLTSLDGTHGFELSAFGIDERIEKGKTTSVEFYAPKKGTYRFRCSHICGIGHLGMTGLLVVD